MLSYIVQNDQFVSPASIIMADGMEDAASSKSGKELLNEESEKATGDDGEVEIVNHEGTIKDKWFPVLHEVSSTEDNDVVC